MNVCFLVLLLPLLGLNSFYLNYYTLQFALSLITFMLIVWSLSRSFSLFDIRTLVLSIGFTYICVAPIGVIYFDGYMQPGFSYWLSEESTYFSLAYGTIMLSVMFLCFHSFKDFSFHLSNKTIKLYDSNISVQIPFIIFLMVITLCMYQNISEFGFSLGAISRGEIYSNKSTFIQILTAMIAPTFLYSYFTIFKQQKNSFILKTLLYSTIGFYLLYTAIIMGDRKIVLQFILAILVLKQLLNPVNFKTIFIRSVFFILFIPSLIIWGKFRNQSFSEYASIWNNLEVSNLFNPLLTEFGGAAFVADNLYTTNIQNYMQPSYLESFLEMVPSAVWADRPDGPARWFVWEYYPNYAASGGAFAFNALYESLMNFWYLGPIFAGILWASLIILGCQIRNSYQPLIISILAFNFMFFYRADLVSVIKPLSICLATFFLVYLCQFSSSLYKIDLKEYPSRHNLS